MISAVRFLDRRTAADENRFDFALFLYPFTELSSAVSKTQKTGVPPVS
jgi:hypothetical protein